MTNCEHIANRYSAYRDAELAESERETFETHLEGCRDCRALVDQWDDALADLAEYGGFPVPDDFEELVLSRLAPELSPPQRRPAWPFVLTAVAASLLTVWVLQWMGPSEEAKPSAEHEAHVDRVQVEAISGEAETLDWASGRWRLLKPGMSLLASSVLRGTRETTIRVGNNAPLRVPAGSLAWVGLDGARLLGEAQPPTVSSAESRPLYDAPERPELASSNRSQDPIPPVHPSVSKLDIAWPTEAVRAAWQGSQSWQAALVAGQSRWWSEMSELVGASARWTDSVADRLRAEMDVKTSPVGPLPAESVTRSTDFPASGPTQADIAVLPSGDARTWSDPRETLTVLRRRGQVELVTRGTYSKRIPLLLDILENEPALRDLARVQLEEILGELERNRVYRSGQPIPFPQAESLGAMEWLTDGASLPPALQPDGRRQEEEDRLRRWREWWNSNQPAVARVEQAPTGFF